MTLRLLIASGIFHPESGGPATYLYEILPELQQCGFDVRVLTFGDGLVDSYPYPVTRIPRRALPLRLTQYALAARPLLQWADLIFQHTLGLPLPRLGKIPRVLKTVGDMAWERSIRRGWIAPTEDVDVFQTKSYGTLVRWQKTVRAREARSMDAVIVPSMYLKRMVTGWGVEADRVHVVYNALPPEAPAISLSQSDARRKLGLGDEPIILTPARLMPWKGIDHLIAALPSLPDVSLLVAGDGPLLESLKGHTATLGVEKRVVFLGNVPRRKLLLYMKAADYTALYSGYEGLSHTLLESLRAGTPIIASDKGGNPEVVQRGVNGLLVPYVNLDALIAALHEALRPGKRDLLAANCSVGMERFEFGNMVAQTIAVLTSTLQAQ